MKMTGHVVISRVLLVVLLAAPRAAPAAEGEAVDFSREILPLLSEKCFICHGPAGEAKDVLRLDSFAAASRERDGRRAVDPESPE
ncbi:MAG: hypothetical protein VB859_10105, partial [Planctomycetaceae bacterium]